MVTFLGKRAPKQKLWTVAASMDNARKVRILDDDPERLCETIAARPLAIATHRLPTVSSSENTFGFFITLEVADTDDGW